MIRPAIELHLGNLLEFDSLMTNQFLVFFINRFTFFNTIPSTKNLQTSCLQTIPTTVELYHNGQNSKIGTANIISKIKQSPKI